MKVVPFKVPQTKNEAFRFQEDSLPHFYDRLHQHDEHQVMWVQQSEGTLILGDYVGRFQEGDLFFLGGNQTHVFRNDEEYFNSKTLPEAKSISLYFNETYLGSAFWDLIELQDVRKFLSEASRGIRIDGQTKSLLIEQLEFLRIKTGTERIVIFLKMLDILVKGRNDLEFLSAVTNVNNPFSTNEGKRMNDILQFTFNNSYRKILIEEVAHVANLSTEAFCRYFKTRTMKTYTTFLNEVRISRAIRMLITNRDLPITEICFQTGFSNLSNFNRVFKRVTGKTPSQYI